MSTDDDVVAYLEGEDVPGLDPGERGALDDIRVLLADPAVWAEPPSGLGDDIVDAITAQVGTAVAEAHHDRRSHERRWLLAVAAAVIVILGAGTIALRPWESNGTAAPHFAMALSPTPLAPDASGTAKLTKKASGWHVDMNATGLARLDNGRYYEAWLKNAAGTLVPIGTFNDARDLELWAGVSPVDYPTLTVTIEAADGNETSSGRRVLIGTIIR